MANEAARVLEDALRLPAEERAEIADELLTTLYDYEAEVDGPRKSNGASPMRAPIPTTALNGVTC